MALPPSPAAMPAAAPMGAPDAAPDMPMDGAPEEAAEPEVIATICKTPDGKFMLYAGDEPDAEMAPAAGGEEAPPEGKTFDTPQALMRGVMELLNPAAGAEDSFAKGFKGEPDATAAKPDMAPPGM